MARSYRAKKRQAHIVESDDLDAAERQIPDRADDVPACDAECGFAGRRGAGGSGRGCRHGWWWVALAKGAGANTPAIAMGLIGFTVVDLQGASEGFLRRVWEHNKCTIKKQTRK